MLNKKRNKFKFLLLGGFSLACFLPALVVKAASTGYFNYQLLEGIPGFFSKGQIMTDLPTLVSAIYKFGIWTIGIAAMFMLVVGGLMYMTSAGNKSTAGSAKGIITDALLGLAVAFTAYLFLYVINPDLIKLNLNLVSVKIEEVTQGTPQGSGVCAPVASGACSVQSLKTYFDLGIQDPNIDGQKWAEQASSICNVESFGKVDLPSGSDICKGYGQNSVASWGLFQINISANDIAGVSGCTKAFNTPLTAREIANPSLCYVYSDATSQAKYSACKEKAKDANANIKTAWSIYKSTGYSWGRWGANKICKFAKGSARK